MNVTDLIPKEGFLPAYMDYVTRLTDAPETYHVVSALSVLSGACSRIVEGRFDVQAIDGTVLSSVYPTSLWVLIIGPSGDRKTTAMTYATQIGSGSGVIEEVGAISGSPEGTFDLVAKIPDIFMYHPEGSTLFGQLQASYWAQGQGFLCDLYDGRDDPPYVRILSAKRTKKDEDADVRKVIIRRPRVTMLIGIAPDLLDQARKSDWTGGLIGRMLLVYGERSRYDETPPKQDPERRAKLEAILGKMKTDLKTFTNGHGLTVGMTRDALEAYIVWARDLDVATTSRPPKLRSLFRRLPLHVMRIAALYAVSQFKDVVDPSSMIPAIRLGDYSHQSIERVGNLLADDPIMRNAVKIRDMLERTPGNALPVGMISESLRMSWAAIEPAIKTLIVSGKVRQHLDEENIESRWVQLIV